MSRKRVGVPSLLALGLGVALVAAGVSRTLPARPAAFDPLTRAEASRVLLRVLDTESSLGPLSATPQPVTIEDLVRFHGHPCDGLIAAAEGISLGLEVLFPDGVVDRTDVAGAANASPCYSDVAAYLTGARTLYGTLVIDKSLGDEWLLLRRSTGKAVRVRLKPGVKPEGLPVMEARLRREGCDATLIARVQALQLQFIHRLLSSPPASLFEVKTLSAFPYAVKGERPDAEKARCAR